MKFNFPLTVVDNFFENPYGVIEYANSLNYSNERRNYPGGRTADLYQINRDFFNSINNKILSIFFDREKSIESKCCIFFQKETYQEMEKMGKAAHWIHHDVEFDLIFIVYLNPNLNAGTSVYKQKKDFAISPYNFNGPSLFSEKNMSLKDIDKIYKEHAEYYELISLCNGNFNTAFIFPCKLAHAANVIDNFKKQDRLFLIGMMGNFISEKMPLDQYHYHKHYSRP